MNLKMIILIYLKKVNTHIEEIFFFKLMKIN